MKACDSWPGNKAEEGRLPSSAHTLRHSEITHSCMRAGFNTSGSCCPTGPRSLINPGVVLLCRFESIAK